MSSHGQLRKTIPSHCFRPSTPRSLAYLARDVAALVLVYAVAVHVDNPWAWPLLWFIQGTLLWALFLVGHDCGHGAFSRSARLNSWVGHITHTPLLVPYHSWRLSHRRHHRHCGDIARDEAWFPLTADELSRLPAATLFARRYVPFLMFPFYLLRNSPERRGSHFSAASPLFEEAERPAIRRSLLAVFSFAVGLLAAAYAFGPVSFIRFWLGPYLVFAAWLGVVTLLHHTDPSVPWYRGGAWTPFRGALTAVDRDYGFFERIHHDVGSHAVHHLFPSIPHYHLREATRAAAPVLGAEYHRATEPVTRALIRALTECGCVPEAGDIVRYQTWPSTEPTDSAARASQKAR